MTFTNDGIQTKTLQEFYAELEAEYKEIYGIDTDIDQDSPDGQKIGIEAKAKHDFQNFGVALYNSFDPDFADGLAMYKILKLTGITAKTSTQSLWDLEVESDRIATLPNGYTIKDDLEQEWYIDSDVSLVEGVNTVTFKSVDFGAVEGVASSEITEVTPEPFIVEILAPIDATIGRDEETIEDLRIRRNKSLLNPSYSLIGTLYAKIGNLSGVTDLVVYENDTDIDEVDIPKRTIWVIVEGGEVNEIAKTLAIQKTGGVGLKGDVVGTYEETILRPDGNEFYYTHTMNFDRPDYIDIYVTLNAKLLNLDFTLDTDLIKQELAKATFTIGESIKVSKLYQFAYNAGNTFTITNLEISKDNVTFTDDILEPLKKRKV